MLEITRLMTTLWRHMPQKTYILQVITLHLTLTSTHYCRKKSELTRCLCSCLDFDINSTHDLGCITVTSLNLVSHTTIKPSFVSFKCFSRGKIISLSTFIWVTSLWKIWWLLIALTQVGEEIALELTQCYSH